MSDIHEEVIRQRLESLSIEKQRVLALKHVGTAFGMMTDSAIRIIELKEELLNEILGEAAGIVSMLATKSGSSG